MPCTMRWTSTMGTHDWGRKCISFFVTCFSQNDHGTSISHKFQVNSACKGAKITKCKGLPLLFLCIHAPRLLCKQLEHVFWRMYSFSNFVVSRISFKLLIKICISFNLFLLKYYTIHFPVDANIAFCLSGCTKCWLNEVNNPYCVSHQRT